jgi:hypothetical protein
MIMSQSILEPIDLKKVLLFLKNKNNFFQILFATIILNFDSMDKNDLLEKLTLEKSLY